MVEGLEMKRQRGNGLEILSENGKVLVRIARWVVWMQKQYFEIEIWRFYNYWWWVIRGSVLKESACQCRKCGFNSWVREIPGVGNGNPTLVFLPGKFHGQRSLTGYRVHGVAELGTTEHTHAQSLRVELCVIGGEKVIGTKGVKELRNQKIRWWMLKSLRMVIKNSGQVWDNELNVKIISK